ncbi:MATE family efflux transporter [Fusibacter ferrireducens]|uniref:Multidrug export protein MepA n=1 Tax=Fusibacter ferrireducens TaxID=2785058 RepID=A0ABR9ZP28_9FIRM|nr:MATE family efflux transporter [Fusibacter ferrireducens]MBF4692201.1 MATE family efflux transporter [Fusibacter ferrireducens]
MNNPLAKDFTLSSLLQFAFPTIVMMLFMGMYTIGDTIIIARFVNTDALSALNIVTPVINIIVGLGTMLATGGSAIVARKMGEGDAKRASQDFTLIILAGAIVGIIVAITGHLLIDNMIWRLGASKLLFPYCKQYLSNLLMFTPACMMQLLFQNLIVTAGKPGFGMTLSIGAGIINLLIDYIFVIPMNMGIAGAAFGTGIGYMIPSIIGILFFLKAKGTLQFQKPIVDFHVLWESSSNGFSEMVSQIATAITTFLFNRTMMKLLGESGVAAITIIIYTQFLLTALFIGFSMGVAPIISYNFGSRNYDRLKRIFRICLLFICVISIVIFATAMLLGSPLVRIFSPIGTPVYETARQGFLIFPISFLFCGFNIFASATFTALSNGRVSAIISALRTFVFISIALLILPQFLDVMGVWIAVPLAELLTVFVSLAFILKNKSL